MHNCTIIDAQASKGFAELIHMLRATHYSPCSDCNKTERRGNLNKIERGIKMYYF